MKNKKIEPIWTPHASGLLVPNGTTSNISESTSETYLAIKEKAIAIEELYADSKVILPKTCGLARLIAAAKRLSDSWLLGDEKSPIDDLFSAAHLDRIADAVQPLRTVEERAHYLRILASGQLDLLARGQSRAKDALWELELWAILKRKGFLASLQEPPDIVTAFDDVAVGIACKKIYSEKHVQNVLSQAVKQIEGAFNIGIVAINIDELVPGGHILRMPTQEAMSEHISRLNATFLQKHERHFRKYLASGRVISALVSTSVLADVFRAKPRFNNARQSTVWTIPGLPVEKDRQLRNFYNLLMA